MSTQIIAGLSDITGAATYYSVPSGYQFGLTESTMAGIVSTPGIIKNLRVRLTVAPGLAGSGKEYDVTIYKNGLPSILTVNIFEIATIGNDLINQISFSVGDTISIEIKPTSSPASGKASWSFEFEPTTNGETLLLSNSGGIVSVNEFILPTSGHNGSVEFYDQIVIPCSGVIKQLYIKVDTSPGGSDTYIFIVRKNGIDQSLSTTLTGLNTTGNDIVNNINVSAGDLISIQRTGTSANNPNVNLGLTFFPDTIGNFILSFSTSSSLGTSTIYLPISGDNTSNSSESPVAEIFSACIIKNIYINLNAAPGVGKSRTLTLRSNLFPTALTKIISDTDTFGFFATDITINDDDILSVSSVPAGTPASGRAQISFTGLIAVPVIQKTITSDVHFQGTILPAPSIISDVWFKGENQQLLTSDVYFISNIKTITSDVHFKGTEQKTILSDVKFVIESFYNINNKVNFVNQALYNINNYVNTVKRVFKDINNDVRTKKQPLYNITNDIRFIKSWQKSATFGFQSLGKSYIRVYIGGIEQTDVDVDSIKFFKAINQAHTASFDLGRAYDGTKPVTESIVLIKYNDWDLYTGYITSIVPSSNPESMTINCHDKYWYENRTKKYFKVGHKPSDDRELYYNTIQTALSTEALWSVSVGNFVPQIIDCFGIGASDAITNLITESGNYGWFYDVNGNKKLWTAGAGDIVEIQRQVIGTNMGLYQLIEHNFTDDISGIINKYRVQMGDRVIRKFASSGGSRQYSGYVSSYFQGTVTPAWDETYEILAKNSPNGYGWDAHKPEDDYLYKDIFKKYNLPYLNSALESWTDWKAPQVNIYGSQLFNFKEGLLEAGYSIDYENKYLILNDVIYSYTLNTNGECIAVRAPVIKVKLWKRKYYTSTASESEDPETTESSPLIFITAKMGSYATTIIGDLNLSSFSIQEGGTYVDGEGITQVIPSWDDTDFAKDYADWQLSKICDKKIKGNIQLTLDCVCFNTVDLTKRININGITDNPMNILSMSYDLSNFTVTIELENSRAYNRTESMPTRGE